MPIICGSPVRGQRAAVEPGTIAINGATQTFPPAIPHEQQAVIDAIRNNPELAH